LVLFGLLVLAGVFGEWRADIEQKNRLHQKALSIFSESENFPPIVESLWKKHKNFFGFLVVIGVLGEFACDAIITISSTQLQTIGDRENAVLQAKAMGFERDAESFRLKADELEAKLLGVETNIAQTSSNVTRIDPLKQRITDISAIMRYKGVFFPDVRRGTNDDKTLRASLHLFDLGNVEKGQFLATTNGNGVALPVLDLVAKASKREGDEFVIEFGMDRLDFELKGSQAAMLREEVLGLTPNSSLESFLDKINGFEVTLLSSDVNVDGIKEGTVTLFSGTFAKIFTFPPQRVLVEAFGGAWPVREYDRLPTNNLPILQVPAK
jgi:hypothetical protein